jgi:RNA methyltransferase, TrmH family
LVDKRSARWAERVFVIEGVELVRAALDAEVVLEGVYVGAKGTEHSEVADLISRALGCGLRVYDLGPGVLERVADTVTPQPVLAIGAMVDVALDRAVSAAGLAVVCVDVRDPGNLGTVLRTADAAGAAAVICCGGTVDVYNPKTVRASAGSLFHVPVVVTAEPLATVSALSDAGLVLVGALAHGGDDYTSIDWSAPTALVLGNEASGLPEALVAQLDRRASIALEGAAESLNVSVAGAVLCFEALRQRRARMQAPTRSADPVASTMPEMSEHGTEAGPE